MIDRFSIGVPASILAERFKAEEPTAHIAKYNGAPSQLFPVITSESPQGFSYFYWGMAPAWAKNKTLAERIINTRAEQIAEKAMLKKTLAKNRCLIPADGFYAWKKVGKKTFVPWRFVLPTKEVFSIAGLWEEYDDEEGDSFHTFTMITTPADGLVISVVERMPLILTQEQEAVWLKKESGEAELLSLISSAKNPAMDGFTVSPQLNSIQYDRPSLILPTPAADQFGNLTLFD
jgi:putative SOS response-associated peptidase YedK